MPQVPSRTAPNQAAAPDIPPEYLAMAAATMHEMGRLFEPAATAGPRRAEAEGDAK